MTSHELRQKFQNFFKQRGHIVLPSASLAPENDPTVLFTTAGMFPFKRYYSYPSEAPNGRITTSQKCVRTGDIDEVGDATHLTFFEMLGNFSFGYPEREGSYFKKESIEFAWEFLTEVLGIEKNRIYATYFQGERGVPADTESLELLQRIDGLPEIKPQGFDDNFWSLGTENSPGGPTVEFYVDGIEVWNLVFNEFVMRNGKYEPAQYKGVDTGMGLERLLAVLNTAENVYHTDLFELPHRKLHEIGHLEGERGANTFEVSAERIILDHIKAATFIIGDGITPSNKDQGYVVRRLIRRAIVKGQQLGIEQNFVTDIAKEVFNTYRGVYFEGYSESFSRHFERSEESRTEGSHVSLDSPWVKGDAASPGSFTGVQDDTQENRILGELEKEETKFRRTLREGLKLVNSFETIDGKVLFDLYQSYGLPLEISVEEVQRRGIDINNSTIEQFNNLLREHQELSRTASAGMFKGGLAHGGEMETKYHTATHLLLAALRKVLGDHVVQRGSNITTERLRFDFSHPEKMTPEQIREVENLVNEQIRKDLPVTCEEMTVDEAKNQGAMGVFESKYGEKVKVYTIGERRLLEGERGALRQAQGTVSLSNSANSLEVTERADETNSSSDELFSKEICGGPHVTHTGELGRFKITKEEASSAGIRRIKAVLE